MALVLCALTILSVVNHAQLLNINNTKYDQLLLNDAKNKDLILDEYLKTQEMILNDPKAENVILDDPKTKNVTVNDPKTENVILNDPKTGAVVWNDPKTVNVILIDPKNESLMLNETNNENATLSYSRNEYVTLKDSKTENVISNNPEKEDVMWTLSKSESVRDLTWNETMDVLKSKTFSRLSKFHLTNISSTVNVSQKCRETLHIFETSLSNWETWAVMMWDASGGLPSGILDGRVTSFGSFDQCLGVRVPMHHFQGQYCMLGMQTPLLTEYYDKHSFARRNEKYEDVYGEPPEWVADFMARSGPYLKHLPFFLSTCIPSTCSEDDVKAIYAQVSKPYGFSVTRIDCQVDKTINWETCDIVAMSFIGLVTLLCLLGTATDIVIRWLCVDEQCKNPALECLLAFSVPANAAKMVEGRQGESLGCLDGLRFLSFMWIIVKQVVAVSKATDIAFWRNFLDMTEGWTGYLTSMFVDGAYAAVDTFFVISGFLLVFTTWKRLEMSAGRLKFILKFMLQKYMRLTPSLVLTIALFMLMYKLGSGPFWKFKFEKSYEKCQVEWWKNILYINNWPTGSMCLSHTWFLSALMQLHLIGIILLCIVYRWPKTGTLLIAVVFMIGTFAHPAWRLIRISYPMTRTFYAKDIDFVISEFIDFHVTTFSHLSSYIFGMSFGYLYLKHNKQLPNAILVSLWFLAACSFVYVVCGKYFYPESKVHIVFYIISFRTIYAAGLSWLIYACCSGQGGVVNRILSWQGFVVLSRISYLLYLLHILVTRGVQMSTREALSYGVFSLVMDVLSYTSLVIIITVVAYVAVELPFGRLTTFIFKRSPEDTKPTFIPLKETTPLKMERPVTYN